MKDDIQALYLELARIQLAIMIRDPDAWDKLETQLEEVRRVVVDGESDAFYWEIERTLN